MVSSGHRYLIFTTIRITLDYAIFGCFLLDDDMIDHIFMSIIRTIDWKHEGG